MFKEKEENDFKQDKIVIYNEVIDVMRSIMHLFKKKKEEIKEKRKILGNHLAQNVKRLLEEEDDDENESYTIDKQLIIEAWSKYRPNS